MSFLRRKPRTIYSCGNCREEFSSHEKLRAHHPCPLYLMEKELAERDIAIRAAYMLTKQRD